MCACGGQRTTFRSPQWGLGLELRSLDLGSKHHYLLSHTASPAQWSSVTAAPFKSIICDLFVLLQIDPGALYVLSCYAPRLVLDFYFETRSY